MNVTHIHKCAHISNTPQTDPSSLNSTQINGIICLHSLWFLQMHTHIFMPPVFRHFLQMWFSYSWLFLQLWLIFLSTGKKILTLSLFCPISLNNLKTLTEKRIQNYKSSNMKLTELCRMDAVSFFFLLKQTEHNSEK